MRILKLLVFIALFPVIAIGAYAIHLSDLDNTYERK